ncbi:hypothetical protein A9995_03665 [Erythrobacter sp. QSSC1-22B]|nr:hypothetical protein A9995_03665 [Erythrobacter sp. QSSC1-22B]
MLLIAPLALAACADDSAAPSDDAQAIAQTTPAPGARSDNEVAGVPDAGGNRWFYRPDTQTALFGSSISDGIISMSCNLSLDEDAAVVFQWLAAAQEGVEQTVTVASGDGTANFTVTGTASALGPDAIWNGAIAPGDPALAFLAATTEPLTFTLGSESVTAPADEAIDRVVTACS